MIQIGSDVGGGTGNEMEAYFYAEFEKLFRTEGRNASFGSSASNEKSDEDSDQESAIPSASSDLGEETTGRMRRLFSARPALKQERHTQQEHQP
jgi:hypothetical protein